MTGSARPMLALALAVAFSSFTASTRPASNHYRTPSSALDRRVTGERNKPNTVAGRMPRGAPAWTGRSHPSTPTGFVSAKAVARAATQRRSWRRGLALGTGKRGCVLGTRMVGTWWDETDPKQGRGWCGGLRRVRGVNRHEPEGRSLVVVGAGTGETEFYSWTETDTDMEVRVTLPPGTPAKKVRLSVTKSSLALELEGREGPVLKGTLKGQVQADLSHWTMEEKEGTREKVLYLCLEKFIDIEALERNGMPTDWSGVLQGEEVVKVYYPDKDKNFDVNEYVKRMGYDRDRDIDKVDKAMFSGLTEEMKQNLAENLPGSSYTEKDDMIPVVSDPKVAPVIDTGVLGVQAAASSLEPERESLENASCVDDGDDRGRASPVSGGRVDPGGQQRVAGVDVDGSSEMSPDLTTTGEASRPPRELTVRTEDKDNRQQHFPHPVDLATSLAMQAKARQREISAGLRDTYERLLRSGMLGRNPDATPVDMPDMDELAREYEQNGFMPKDGDFSEADLSNHAMAMMSSGLDEDGATASGLDLNDPAVRAAFDLEGGREGEGS